MLGLCSFLAAVSWQVLILFSVALGAQMSALIRNFKYTGITVLRSVCFRFPAALNIQCLRKLGDSVRLLV